MMQDCVFCKIIAGDIPCQKLYEDDRVFAFLDNRPVRTGHAMVIPKIHVDHFIDLDDGLAAHICKVGNALGRKMQSVLKPLRVGFVVSGFGVAHAHYHVIPMWDANDITSCVYARIKNGRIVYSMDHLQLLDDSAENETAKLLTL